MGFDFVKILRTIHLSLNQQIKYFLALEEVVHIWKTNRLLLSKHIVL